MYVWLANLQPDAQKSFLELIGQPRAGSKATDEKCELFPEDQELSLRSSKYMDRIFGKALAEVILDGVNGGLDGRLEEPRNFRAVCVKV
jgi:hypothetical protein